MSSPTSPLPTAVARRRSEGRTVTVHLDDLASEPGSPSLGRAELRLATSKAGLLVGWSTRGTPDAPVAAVGSRLLSECSDELRALGRCRLLVTVPGDDLPLSTEWLERHGFVRVRDDHGRTVLALDL